MEANSCFKVLICSEFSEFRTIETAALLGLEANTRLKVTALLPRVHLFDALRH